jgi:glutamate transport system permease protein
MSAVLYDELGPRGRRKVRVATVVSMVVLAAVAYLVVARFQDRGQLDGDRWRPLTEWAQIKFLLEGLWLNIRIAVVAMAAAIAVGGLMAVLRLSLLRGLRWVSGGYVEIFRALPLLLLIYFTARVTEREGIDLPDLLLICIPLVAYNSAIIAEIFRAGILSLDRGQSEAAYAVGLTYSQTMRLVLVPQAVRRMLPALVSQLITLLKDTTLAVVIPIEEGLRRAQILGEFNANILQTYLVTAVAFILINLVLSRIARRLEQRQRRRLGAGDLAATGAGEDVAVLAATDVKRN